MVVVLMIFRISDPITTIEERETFQKHICNNYGDFFMLKTAICINRKILTTQQKSLQYHHNQVICHKIAMIWIVKQFCERNIRYCLFVWQLYLYNGMFLVFVVVVQKIEGSFVGLEHVAVLVLVTLKIIKNVFTLHIFDKLIENPKVA